MTERQPFPAPRRAGRFLALAAAAALAGAALAAPAPAAAANFTVYKSPWCGCCGGWVAHLRAKGHTVTVRDVENLEPIKKVAEIPDALRACHTALVDGYVIEGHVPEADIARLLATRPKAKGLAVPGMPAGAPGMGGTPQPYDVILFGWDGAAKVYARH